MEIRETVNIYTWLNIINRDRDAIKKLIDAKLINKDLKLLNPDNEEKALTIVNEYLYKKCSTWDEYLALFKSDVELFNYVVTRKIKL